MTRAEYNRCQIKNYELMGFRLLHREEILGKDQVREVLLQIGESPNLIQLIEPLSPESPVQQQIDKNHRIALCNLLQKNRIVC